MNDNFDPHLPILVAIPDEWWNDVNELLTKHGYLVLNASTREEALQIIQSQPISGLIIVSDWAISGEDGESSGLMELIKGKIPSVSLIKPSRVYSWFDELYDPPLHQTCTTPFSPEELLLYMKMAKITPGQTQTDEE